MAPKSNYVLDPATGLYWPQKKILRDREYRKRPEIKARDKARRSTLEFKIKQRALAKIRLQKQRSFIQNFKKSRKCVSCGYKEHPEVLAFHHKNSKEKSFNISISCMFSRKNLLVEINKCILLCPNCHNWLHHPNNQNKEIKSPFKSAPLTKEELLSLEEMAYGRRTKYSNEVIDWIKSHRKEMMYRELLVELEKKFQIGINLNQLRHILRYYRIYKRI